MRILIIEDEAKAVAYLEKGLTELGYVVDAAETGLRGLQFAHDNTYDAVILDISLPDIDGWAILDVLRKTGDATPIICVTARDAIDDRVRGLTGGADDYLVKPFAFSELVARLQAITRRQRVQSSDSIKVADLEVVFSKHLVIRAGGKVHLTTKEYMLLALLISHHGDVVTRTYIAEKIWDMNFDSDTNVVDVAIRRLRRKIDDPHTRKLIHTVRGVGYVLESR